MKTHKYLRQVLKSVEYFFEFKELSLAQDLSEVCLKTGMLFKDNIEK
jgi:hypothetical protein